MNKIDISIFLLLLFVVITLIFIKFKNNNKEHMEAQIKNILKPNNIKEDFIVSDAQDIQNYQKLKDEVLKEPDNYNKENIINPGEKDKVDVNNKKEDNYTIQIVNGEPKSNAGKLQFEKSFITATDFGWDNPFPVVGCANSSIDSRFKSGPKRLLPRDISCGFPNKLTAENYYKTHYMAEIAKLEDTHVRGANYMEYSEYVHPTMSNIRILSQNTKGLPPKEMKYKNIPVGFGYGFHNTPAQPMP